MANNLKQLRMDGFRGVDFSSSPLKASSYRAVSGKNWINENGVNKKRNGWEQILPKLGDKINGIFPYKTEDGTEILIFTDKKAFRVYKNYSEEWTSSEVYYGTSTYASAYANNRLTNLADRKLMAVYGRDGIYIPAGGYYFYNSGILYELDAYADGMTARKAYQAGTLLRVPRTTIDISPQSYAPTAQSLDAPNLLTPYRINELIGKDTNNSYADYTLDAMPDSETDVDVYADGNPLTQGAAADYVIIPSTNTIRIRGDYDEKKITVVFRHDISRVSDDYVDFPTAFRDQAIGENNICTTFGIGGYSDRMFLAGNMRNNRVYFSEEDDYSYFPHDFYADIGSSASKVTAFLRLADETLAIFKEHNGNDPSVYYMSGRRDISYNDDGTVNKVTPVFSFAAGATTETAVNAFVTGNLVGDSLIASKHGVYAIALTENYATNTRTARDRSRLINERLMNMDLSEATSVVYRGKYYLAVGSEVFIADANFKWQPSEGEWWQYEWYYWDHVPVRCWAVVDDVLMFGTADGRLCAFDDPDLYMDRLYEEIVNGQVTEENDTIAFSETIKNIIQNGSRVRITSGYWGVRIVSEATSDDQGRSFVVNDEMAALVEIGDFVCFEDDEGCYSVSNVDKLTKIIYFDNIYHPQYISEDNAIVYKNIFDGSFYVVNKHEETVGGTFQLSRFIDGEPLDITEYSDGEDYEEDRVAMLVYLETPVVAEWKTPVFDMGTNTHRKTLLRLTISAENSVEGGKTNFGYETRQNISTRKAKGIQYFAYDALDFADFTLDLPFASSYTVRSRERGFNYIQFYFKSESPTNCVVNNMTATYRIIAENKGVR